MLKFDKSKSTEISLNIFKVILVFAIFIGYTPHKVQATSQTEIISVNSNGDYANDASVGGSISADGRYVVFFSWATNLPDYNAQGRIYIRDMQLGTTQALNPHPGFLGRPLNRNPKISNNGRYVVFTYNTSEFGTNMYIYDQINNTYNKVDIDVLNCNNGLLGNLSVSNDGRFIAYEANIQFSQPSQLYSTSDIRLFDQQTNSSYLVSVNQSGNPADGANANPGISADGRYVVFDSNSANLVLNDTNNTTDIFVRDLQINTTQRINVSSTGNQANENSFINSTHAISDDGRYVVFHSLATNLVPGVSPPPRPPNWPSIATGWEEAYVHDLQTGTTELVSLNVPFTVDLSGQISTKVASISGNGRYVAFTSIGSNFYFPSNPAQQIYVRDRQTGSVYLASINNSGELSDRGNFNLDINQDGNYVIFNSFAYNLVTPAITYNSQIYIHKFDLNAPLSAPIIGPISTNETVIATGNVINTTSSFTDANFWENHNSIWNWGDGITTSGTIREFGGIGTVYGTHIYVNPGVYIINLTVSDTNNLSATQEFSYIAVYDPTPQSIFTGARKYISPVGAYYPNPNLTGQITFGIVAKYSGSNANANVNMDFKAANMKFDSTQATFLVTANGKATLKGTGTINSAGIYNYLVTGIDSQQNNGQGLIRFQIKDQTGLVVYDSQPGASDTINPITPITGHILVH